MSRYGWGWRWCLVLALEGQERGDAREVPNEESGPATRLLWAIDQATVLSVLGFTLGNEMDHIYEYNH